MKNISRYGFDIRFESYWHVWKRNREVVEDNEIFIVDCELDEARNNIAFKLRK